jgi:hypothetical protein
MDSNIQLTVNNEVSRLIKKKINNINLNNEIEILRIKLNNDKLVQEIQEQFIKKHNSIIKKAIKFTNYIKAKYENVNLPLHIIYEKAKLLKSKYELSDHEFDIFYKYFENDIHGVSNNTIDFTLINHPTTMNKVLGNLTVNYTKGMQKFSDLELKHLDDMFKMETEFNKLHNEVSMQSLEYETCSLEACNARYQKDSKYTKNDHINPVIVALFLHKIPLLEKHFILSNMLSIIKKRYNNQQLNTEADICLFNSLCKDPNDVVCDNRSVVLDLLSRCNIQKELWVNVQSMRSGQYYGKKLNTFLSAIDTCKYNKYDNPNMIYNRYETVVMQRLLSAFSFAPTIISTISTNKFNPFNPYQQINRAKTMAVSIINIDNSLLTANSPFSFNNAIINNNQKYYINNKIKEKITSVMYSEDIIVFCVDRKDIDYSKMYKTPYLTEVPFAISEKYTYNLNTSIDINEDIIINNSSFEFISGVYIETMNTTHANIIKKSIAVIKAADYTKGYLKYDPKNENDNTFEELDINDVKVPTEPNIRTHGIIYIYKKK